MASDEDMAILHRANGGSAWLLALVVFIQIAMVVVIILLGLFSPSVARAQVPQAAQAYRADLTRTARVMWGLDAPVATFAAQVHQESGWKPNAVSRVGAAGLAQFMPATSKWISGIYPELAGDQPFNPAWAMRALVKYDRWILDRVRAATPCDGFAMVLSGYNGGLGWVQRDQVLASSKGLDPLRWWDAVERVNAGRTPANWTENRDYPRRILLRHEPVYVAAGWGQGACS